MSESRIARLYREARCVMVSDGPNRSFYKAPLPIRNDASSVANLYR